MEVRGQHWGAGYLPPPFPGSWGLNSGHWTCMASACTCRAILLALESIYGSFKEPSVVQLKSFNAAHGVITGSALKSKGFLWSDCDGLLWERPSSSALLQKSASYGLLFFRGWVLGFDPGFTIHFLPWLQRILEKSLSYISIIWLTANKKNNF